MVIFRTAVLDLERSSALIIYIAQIRLKMSDGDKLVNIERQIESLAQVVESLQLKVERICVQGTDDNQEIDLETDSATASNTHSRQHFSPTVITDISVAVIQRDFDRIRDTLNRVSQGMKAPEAIKNPRWNWYAWRICGLKT